LTTPEAQVIVVANSKEQGGDHRPLRTTGGDAPSVEQQFEPRFRELRGPDGSALTVKSADAGRLLGLTPSLVLYDEFCVAKDDEIYTALRSALLPGATMAVVSTAGWGAESPLGRLRAKCLAQPNIRVRGCLTDARGESLRMLEWMVPDATPIGDYKTATRANPLSLITPRWLKEQREALHEIDYRRFHRNEWVGRIGSIGKARARSSPGASDASRAPGQHRSSSRCAVSSPEVVGGGDQRPFGSAAKGEVSEDPAGRPETVEMIENHR
jgi:hypothetical protein